MASATPSQPVSVDELIALSEEIRALARAGVPLERGLVELGRELPGRLGKLVSRIGDRLEQGQPLERVVQEAAQSFPPAYAAVLIAGIRSGRLPAALQDICTTARQVAELKRSLWVGLIYPCMVLLVAYGVLLLTLGFVLPRTLELLRDTRAVNEDLVIGATRLGETLPIWAPWPPLILGLLIVWWWVRSTRGSLFSGRAGVWTWLDGPLLVADRLVEYHRGATLAHMLALLLENRVGLPEAVVLAAETTGNRRLVEATRRWAEQLRAGQPPETAPAGWPPLLVYMLSQDRLAGRSGALLRHWADIYHTRAQRAAERLVTQFPFWITVGLGGTAALILALLVFGTWTQVLMELGPQG